MPKKPTIDDARLILQLYDLRREAEMRKARHWWVATFWPKCADDFVKVATAMGTEENNWLRQVGGYWGIAVSFVLNGVLSEKLFFSCSFKCHFAVKCTSFLRRCGRSCRSFARR